MDTLVAQYSRPSGQQEDYSQDEQQELLQLTPPLSLKFALPPIAQVSSPQALHELAILLPLPMSFPLTPSVAPSPPHGSAQ